MTDWNKLKQSKSGVCSIWGKTKQKSSMYDWLISWSPPSERMNVLLPWSLVKPDQVRENGLPFMSVSTQTLMLVLFVYWLITLQEIISTTQSESVAYTSKSITGFTSRLRTEILGKWHLNTLLPKGSKSSRKFVLSMDLIPAGCWRNWLRGCGIPKLSVKVGSGIICFLSARSWAFLCFGSQPAVTTIFRCLLKLTLLKPHN